MFLDDEITFKGGGETKGGKSRWFYKNIDTGDDIYYNSVLAKYNDEKDELYLGIGYEEEKHKITDKYERYSFTGKRYQDGSAVYGSNDIEVSIKKPICINLTSIFGKGNEPTRSQMDNLLEQFEEGRFEGTENLFNTRHFMNMYFDKMRELDDLITEIGGEDD